MPFNSVTNRNDADPLIPEEVSREIIKALPQQSAVLPLCKRLPNMSRKQFRMPVMNALATAYFVNGDTGLKQTTKLSWENKYIDAEEIAVIVPIPESVLDDEDYDIWGEVRPALEEAFGVVIDAAMLFGTNAPATWPNDLFTGATAAGHVVSAAAYADLFEAILGEDGANPANPGALMLIENDGYIATAHLAHIGMRGKLRNVRDANGNPIFVRSMQGSSTYDLDGGPVVFPRNGCMDPATAWMFSGDWSQIVYSFRQDITYKILSEAVIQDAAGNIILNLAQQDMVALRAVMRMGWQLPNPINRMNQVEATRYPFAVLTA